jgi:hypothetical protein
MSVYAVNTKEPILAWIPSRDDSGNGTTTLNDLVGSTTGTLQNFALTGSTSNWIADTSNGGVRAIHFDGTNDQIVSGSNTLTNGLSRLSIMLWAKRNGTLNNFAGVASKGTSVNTRWVVAAGGGGFGTTSAVFFAVSNGANTFGYTSALPFANTDWHHIAMVFDGNLTGNSNRLKAWVDGTAETLTFNGTIPATISTGTTPVNLGLQATTYGQFTHDDSRIFDVGLDSTDIAYGYNSGNGRGRITSTTASSILSNWIE